MTRRHPLRSRVRPPRPRTTQRVLFSSPLSECAPSPLVGGRDCPMLRRERAAIFCWLSWAARVFTMSESWRVARGFSRVSLSFGLFANVV